MSFKPTCPTCALEVFLDCEVGELWSVSVDADGKVLKYLDVRGRQDLDEGCGSTFHCTECCRRVKPIMVAAT